MTIWNELIRLSNENSLTWDNLPNIWRYLNYLNSEPSLVQFMHEKKALFLEDLQSYIDGLKKQDCLNEDNLKKLVILGQHETDTEKLIRAIPNFDIIFKALELLEASQFKTPSNIQKLIGLTYESILSDPLLVLLDMFNKSNNLKQQYFDAITGLDPWYGKKWFDFIAEHINEQMSASNADPNKEFIDYLTQDIIDKALDKTLKIIGTDTSIEAEVPNDPPRFKDPIELFIYCQEHPNFVVPDEQWRKFSSFMSFSNKSFEHTDNPEDDPKKQFELRIVRYYNVQFPSYMEYKKQLLSRKARELIEQNNLIHLLKCFGTFKTISYGDSREGHNTNTDALIDKLLSVIARRNALYDPDKDLDALNIIISDLSKRLGCDRDVLFNQVKYIRNRWLLWRYTDKEILGNLIAILFLISIPAILTIINWSFLLISCMMLPLLHGALKEIVYMSDVDEITDFKAFQMKFF